MQALGFFIAAIPSEKQLSLQLSSETMACASSHPICPCRHGGWAPTRARLALRTPVQDRRLAFLAAARGGLSGL